MIDRTKDEQYHEMLNNGEMYDSVDDEFIAYQHELVQRLNEFNRTDETPAGLKERDEILKEICGTYGEDLYVLPGITIGDNSIIGAGSVVTKDIPANVIAVGSPAKVLREITEDDDRYEGGKPIPQEMLDKYQ